MTTIGRPRRDEWYDVYGPTLSMRWRWVAFTVWLVNMVAIGGGFAYHWVGLGANGRWQGTGFLIFLCLCFLAFEILIGLRKRPR